MQALVTILIPNYQTVELTKLCLRSLHKYTNLSIANVIVIDNYSQDKSLDYLKTLHWITLIERQTISGETPAEAHARALDLGLLHVSTPYVLSIHTDTLVKHPKWLEVLLEQIQAHNNIAGVGSWKLERKPWWRRCCKGIEWISQLVYYHLLDRHRQHNIVGIGKNYYYLRSHCALYRTDLIKKYQLHFFDGDIAGKKMHKELSSRGYQMKFLPSEMLVNYIEHINHATTVLNPELSTRKRSVSKGLRRIEKSLEILNARAILEDDSLDK